LLDQSPYAHLTRAEIEELLEEREQGVRITFSGKEAAREIARSVQPRIMETLPRFSLGSSEQQADNCIIEGENLQAMVSMYRRRGKVDLILTDPPYNTGNDFRYNDRWNEDPNDPALGELVSADDGARHTKWMRFMWPRLKMMKAMLKPGGVLAICIDHREIFRLGSMLDEIFDQRNRVAIINWQKNYSPKNNVGERTHVSTATEYVLVYANEIDAARTRLLDRSALMDSRYGSIDGDPEPWSPGDPTGPGADSHRGQVYGVQSPFTGEIVYPAAGRCWAAERQRMKARLEGWGSTYVMKDLADGNEKAFVIKGSLSVAKRTAQKILDAGNWPVAYWRDGGFGNFRIKKYLKDVRRGSIPMTYWADDDYESPEFIGSVSWDHEQSGHSQTGLNELNAIVGRGHSFDTVKPIKLFAKIMQIWCPSDGLVLDPFAGSGTTGHATLWLNRESAANRRFVLIEQGRPEKGDPYARSLTANRLKRVITGAWDAGKREPLPGGFEFVALRSRVDAPAVLAMERSLMADTVIASHFDTSRRGGRTLVRLSNDSCKYLVARNDENEGFFLIWEGVGKSPVLDADTYDAIVREALDLKLEPIYHVYARFNVYQSDDIRFYQIPNRILMDFGLSEAADPFNNPDEEKDRAAVTVGAA
jgi:adenine-specific DNA-methyltransferase